MPFLIVHITLSLFILACGYECMDRNKKNEAVVCFVAFGLLLIVGGMIGFQLFTT